MTLSTEKFCLKWNDFQQNIIGSFKELRNETDLADVTLVCEEDQYIEAHKIILSACSPFFRAVLKRNKHSHPLIYMRGLKAKDLLSIVDFIYHGEANVLQEDLDSFLALAEELQLKGLTGSQTVMSDEKEEPTQKSKMPTPPKLEPEPYGSQNTQININESFDPNDTNKWHVSSVVPFDTVVMNVSGDLTKEDMDAKKMSMIERVEDGFSNWRCIVCGKTTKVGSKIQDMKRHTETHLEGFSYPCNQCGKISRSSNALQHHVSVYHRK